MSVPARFTLLIFFGLYIHSPSTLTALRFERLLSGIVFLLAGLVLLRWPNILLAAPEAVVNDESTTGKAIKGLHERYLDRTLKVLHLQVGASTP